ncbi:hypothetical protein OD917_16270 [Flavobacterium sp. SH_e]|uniref:hypothetical protein n=1 Tax=Flavobacterium TaxID=237 RepID=UPI0021E4315F|nr:hypothetical protein [Flavobacterium sp. SH_e]MCV2486490.1 hypothetical protein [Flavobacterium sp. SH_e]
MAKKIMNTGNIFKVIDEKEVRYFQYFYTDPHYLGGNLIWVFNQNIDNDNLNEILDSGYSFYFYTTVEAGIKMKKWKLIGNIEIPDKMNYYPIFRWRDLESGLWYKLKYNEKELLGNNLTEEQFNIPIVSFQFPVGAIEFMIKGKEFFIERTKNFENQYFEKNKRI